MDFGLSFGAEKLYFSKFLHVRSYSVLKDMFRMGLLPDIRGLYREDHLMHDLIVGGTNIDDIQLTYTYMGTVGTLVCACRHTSVQLTQGPGHHEML